jgi:hypothetical protein
MHSGCATRRATARNKPTIFRIWHRMKLLPLSRNTKHTVVLLSPLPLQSSLPTALLLCRLLCAPAKADITCVPAIEAKQARAMHGGRT